MDNEATAQVERHVEKIAEATPEKEDTLTNENIGNIEETFIAGEPSTIEEENVGSEEESSMLNDDLANKEESVDERELTDDTDADAGNNENSDAETPDRAWEEEIKRSQSFYQEHSANLKESMDDNGNVEDVRRNGSSQTLAQNNHVAPTAEEYKRDPASRTEKIDDVSEAGTEDIGAMEVQPEQITAEVLQEESLEDVFENEEQSPVVNEEASNEEGSEKINLSFSSFHGEKEEEEEDGVMAGDENHTGESSDVNTIIVTGDYVESTSLIGKIKDLIHVVFLRGRLSVSQNKPKMVVLGGLLSLVGGLLFLRTDAQAIQDIETLDLPDDLKEDSNNDENDEDN